MTTYIVVTTTSAYQQTLQQYITNTQRLLHDSSGYFSNTVLTDWINEARFKVVEDTACNRILQQISTVANQETYSFAVNFPQGNATFKVLNATLIWGNNRVPLQYTIWTPFNSNVRTIVGFQSTPVFWSQYGQDIFYLGPISDQVYTVEMDTVVYPANLVNLTDTDTLKFPYVRAVPFWAAYRAKQNDQLFDEAERFRQEYIRTIQEIHGATIGRRLGNTRS